MPKRASITVTGAVQGVGFRAYTLRQARGMDVNGYVRNLPSGAVEIVVEGSEEAIQRLIERVRRGPPLSRVQDVSIEFAEPTGEFNAFSIEH